jgi:1-acyl-sn-glycerol-3-phosphate acyltransferase
MYNIILEWARLFLRLYFRRTIVHGQEHIPGKGPLIVASNHPSAFMEASIVATLMGRQLHFLVRGDVFHPKFRWLFKWTNQIPIYRQKDGISNLRKNASSFDLTYQKLAEGNAVIIFPEAKTVLEKKMRPMQRGTAHLAFGTLPLLKEGQELMIQPVGVNFTNPRLPGTEVVVRYGKPFKTIPGTREDRDAIETFTQQLSDAMQPLIIEVQDERNEPLYDVLASVYLKSGAKAKDSMAVHKQLQQLAQTINNREDLEIITRLEKYVRELKKFKVHEAIYFPTVIVAAKLVLVFQLILKSIWWIAGGWIWRTVRQFLFSKLRTDTFQGPTSVGAAMVLYPLISLILVIIFSIADVPLYYIIAWWVVLALGKLIPEPLGLIWKMLLMPGAVQHGWKEELRFFREKV